MTPTVSCLSFKAEVLFDPRPVRVGFVVYKLALGQDFFFLLHSSSVSTISPAPLSPTHMQSHQLRASANFNRRIH
jgi:hypothetical protein